MWKDAEMNLTKKREVRAKLELARKMDKIPSVNQEITQVRGQGVIYANFVSV